MHPVIAPQYVEMLKADLRELDKEMVEIDGASLPAGNCYRLELNPAHVLFNTNCPANLKERIEALLHKYHDNHESSTY